MSGDESSEPAPRKNGSNSVTANTPLSSQSNSAAGMGPPHQLVPPRASALATPSTDTDDDANELASDLDADTHPFGQSDTSEDDSEEDSVMGSRLGSRAPPIDDDMGWGAADVSLDIMASPPRSCCDKDDEYQDSGSGSDRDEPSPRMETDASSSSDSDEGSRPLSNASSSRSPPVASSSRAKSNAFSSHAKQNASTFAPLSGPSTRAYRPWSDAEVAMLERAIEVHGNGNPGKLVAVLAEAKVTRSKEQVLSKLKAPKAYKKKGVLHLYTEEQSAELLRLHSAVKGKGKRQRIYKLFCSRFPTVQNPAAEVDAKAALIEIYRAHEQLVNKCSEIEGDDRIPPKANDRLGPGKDEYKAPLIKDFMQLLVKRTNETGLTGGKFLFDADANKVNKIVASLAESLLYGPHA